MTSVNAASNNPLTLLWALQQQYANGANASAATQAAWDSTPAATTSTTSGSTTSSSNASSTNGVTGGAPSINPNALFVFLSFQEQQSGTQSATGSAQSASTGFSNYAQNLFNSIDTDGDGEISQSEMESAVTAAGGTTQQADALFNDISGGSNSISENQFASALQQADGGHHHHHHFGVHGADGAGGADGGDPLAALLGGATADGATSQVATNPDGSTTTTLTYADGTTITMTTPANDGSSSGSGTTTASGTAANASVVATQNQQNMEQMLANLIQLQSAMAQKSQVTSLAA